MQKEKMIKSVKQELKLVELELKKSIPNPIQRRHLHEKRIKLIALLDQLSV